MQNMRIILKHPNAESLEFEAYPNMKFVTKFIQ